MGGPRITADEAGKVLALYEGGLFSTAIAAQRGHAPATVSAIVNGKYPAKAEPDPSGPAEITVAQQVAVDRAAGETGWEPGRYRKIAAVSGVDLQRVYLQLLGRHPPGPVPIDRRWGMRPWTER